MSRALGKNINVDFLQQTQDKLQDKQTESECHLNVLESTVWRFRTGTDANILIKDIEQYLKDLGR